MNDESDGPWKEGLDVLLPSFFALCLPAVDEKMDWQRGYRALDGELRKILPKSKTGKRHVDRLYQAWLRNGAEAKIFIHMEVQSQQEKNFPGRMMDYRCVLRLAYGASIASFAILAEDRANWRPTEHEETLLGSSLKLTMQTVKLLDFANRIDELEASTNPFASVILAHLKTQATKHDPETRFVWKMRFIRNLYERGFSADQVRQLFRLIDWIMRLPAELDEKVDGEVEKIEKEKVMPFVTGIERRAEKRGMERGEKLGEQRGEQRGKLRGRIHTAIELRFGKVTSQDDALIDRITDLAELDRIFEIAKHAASITEVRKAMKQSVAGKN